MLTAQSQLIDLARMDQEHRDDENMSTPSQFPTLFPNLLLIPVSCVVIPCILSHIVFYRTLWMTVIFSCTVGVGCVSELLPLDLDDIACRGKSFSSDQCLRRNVLCCALFVLCPYMILVISMIKMHGF